MISVRLLLGAVSAAIVIVVSAITLGITLSFAFNALNKIGETHARLIVHAASSKIEAFVEVPRKQVELLSNATIDPDLVLPRYDPSPEWAKRWLKVTRDAYMVNNFELGVCVIFFKENSQIQTLNTRSGSDPMHFTDFAWRYPGTSKVPGQSAEVFQRAYDARTLQQLHGELPYDIPDDESDSNATALWQGLDTLTDFGRLRDVVSGGVHLYARAEVPNRFLVLALVRPIYSNDGTEFYGYGGIGFRISEISNFLRTLPLTQAAAVFAIDSTLVLLGASHTHPVAQIYLNATPAQQFSRGCVSGFYNKQAGGCRLHVSDFPFAPLQAIAADRAFLTSQEQVLRLQDLPGPDGEDEKEKYYVISSPVRSSVAFLRINAVLFLPQRDIIGDVIKGRDTAIGVTCAVLVIAVAISFVVVATALSPLTTIAERMTKAASFQDDGDDGSLSLATEIRQLQVAYLAMNEQLNRIKAFVPASVLVLLERGLDDEAECEQEAMDEEDEDMVDPPSDGAHSDFGGKNDPTTTTTTDGHQHIMPGISVDGVEADAAGSSSKAFPARRSGGGPITTPQQRSRRNSQTSHRSGFSEKHHQQHSSAHPRSPHMPNLPSESDIRSRRSHHVKVGGGGGNAAALLGGRQLGVHAARHRVTVLAVNLLDFNHLIMHAEVDRVTAFMDTLAKTMKAAADANSGVLDLFHGDRFYITFNAVSRVSSHCMAAARTVFTLKAEAEVKKSLRSMRFSMGLSTGAATVGNMGSLSLKRFQAIGSVFTQAVLLERIAKLRQATCLVPQWAFVELQTHYALESTDIAHLTGTIDPSVLAALHPIEAADISGGSGVGKHNANGGLRDAAAVQHQNANSNGNTDNEWMYIVERTQSSNPYLALNMAYSDLARGRSQKAEELLQAAAEAGGDPRSTIGAAVLLSPTQSEDGEGSSGSASGPGVEAAEGAQPENYQRPRLTSSEDGGVASPYFVSEVFVPKLQRRKSDHQNVASNNKRSTAVQHISGRESFRVLGELVLKQKRMQAKACVENVGNQLHPLAASQDSTSAQNPLKEGTHTNNTNGAEFYVPRSDYGALM